MPRAQGSVPHAHRRNKVRKATRGQIGAASRRYRVAREAVLRAGQHAFHGRKRRKRDFRRLWITRISAACRQRDIKYSRFMHDVADKGITINRKSLADLAVADPKAFDEVVAAAGMTEATPVASAE